MQTEPKLHKYDRSLIVKHLNYEDLHYRQSYGLALSPVDSLQIIAKACFDNPRLRNLSPQDTKKEVYHHMREVLNREYLVRSDIVQTENEVYKLLNIYAIPFSSPFEFAMDLIIDMSMQHPYLGMCAGRLLNTIIHMFDISPYTNCMYCNPREMVERIKEDDSCSENEKADMIEDIQQEHNAFLALVEIARRCEKQFYVDRKFDSHPFVRLMYEMIADLKNKHMMSYDSVEMAIQDNCEKQIFNLRRKDQDINGNYLELGLTHYLSHDRGLPMVDAFKDLGTGHVMEAGEFCGIITTDLHKSSVSKTIQLLRYHYEELSKFYINERTTPWSQLLSLKSILSYTKMDTLKAGILCTKRKRASSGQHTLSKILS